MAVTGEEIRRAAELLRDGRLVVFPTETVYGLGANAFDEAAVARIYAAKNRPATSPLIVHVDSVAMAKTVAAAWGEQAQALAGRFWPGPLTLVLPKSQAIPAIVTAGLDTVGVRMPRHPVALELLKRAGIPLAAPSANRFTALSPTTAEHVRRAFGTEVAMVLDAGPAAVGIESTVLSLAESEPVLLRPGMISREQLESVIGPVRLGGGGTGAHRAPGLHKKHYSPHTPLVLGPPEGDRAAYVWHTDPAPARRQIRLPRNAADYGAQLYAVLHELDSESWDLIAVEPPPAGPEWDAIRDRLLRAAHR